MTQFNCSYMLHIIGYNDSDIKWKVDESFYHLILITLILKTIYTAILGKKTRRFLSMCQRLQPTNNKLIETANTFLTVLSQFASTVTVIIENLSCLMCPLSDLSDEINQIY